MEASLVACEGRLGCLRQKLLLVIYRLIATYAYHLNTFAVDYLYATGFAELSPFPSVESMAQSC